MLLVNNTDGKTSLEVKTDESFESKGALFVICISVTTLHSANQKQVFFFMYIIKCYKKRIRSFMQEHCRKTFLQHTILLKVYPLLFPFAVTQASTKPYPWFNPCGSK